ncbi:MAG: hydroxyacylglutathione hydrolase [Chitinivibrionales bacterium]
MNTQIIPIPALSDNYAWLFHGDKSAVIVDPGEARPVERFLENNNLTLSHVLITHHHADHCGGAAALTREFAGCIMMGPDDARLKGCDDPVRGGEERDVLGLPMRVIGAPGHTKTHVLFYFPGLKALFTGDTLFSAGCGRLFEGSAADMYRSLTTCAALSDDTRIYCGHEYTEENLRFALTVDPGNVAITRRLSEVRNLLSRGLASVPSTILMEKTFNPFLRVNDPELRKKLGMGSAEDVDVFARLREMKDRF